MSEKHPSPDTPPHLSADMQLVDLPAQPLLGPPLLYRHLLRRTQLAPVTQPHPRLHRQPHGRGQCAHEPGSSLTRVRLQRLQNRGDVRLGLRQEQRRQGGGGVLRYGCFSGHGGCFGSGFGRFRRQLPLLQVGRLGG